MTIQIQTQVSKTEERQIAIPSFFQNMRWKKSDNSFTSYEFLAFLDENTIVKFWYKDNYTSIQNGTPDEMKLFTNDLFRDDYEEVTEEKFLELYSEVLESLSLKPTYNERTDYVADLESIGLKRKEVL